MNWKADNSKSAGGVTRNHSKWFIASEKLFRYRVCNL